MPHLPRDMLSLDDVQVQFSCGVRPQGLAACSRKALVIGINEYEHLGCRDEGVGDASKIRDVLLQLGFDCPPPLTDRNATASSVFRAVRRTNEDPTKAVALCVFLSTHCFQGRSGDLAVACHDTLLADEASHVTLSALLSASTAFMKMIVVDPSFATTLQRVSVMHMLKAMVSSVEEGDSTIPTCDQSPSPQHTAARPGPPVHQQAYGLHAGSHPEYATLATPAPVTSHALHSIDANTPVAGPRAAVKQSYQATPPLDVSHDAQQSSFVANSSSAVTPHGQQQAFTPPSMQQVQAHVGSGNSRVKVGAKGKTPGVGIELSDFANRGVKGVKVMAIRRNGPADAAKVQPGDVIIAVGSQPVASRVDFKDVLFSHGPGDTVSMTIAPASGAPVTTRSVTLE
ncbi:hypothetical protein DIPPA_32351 [Diplonema papillatum]|nr:hypothetical protein DIPPA_32351 [Diplonema papillatum]